MFKFHRKGIRRMAKTVIVMLNRNNYSISFQYRGSIFKNASRNMFVNGTGPDPKTNCHYVRQTVTAQPIRNVFSTGCAERKRALWYTHLNTLYIERTSLINNQSMWPSAIFLIIGKPTPVPQQYCYFSDHTEVRIAIQTKGALSKVCIMRRWVLTYGSLWTQALQRLKGGKRHRFNCRLCCFSSKV